MNLRGFCLSSILSLVVLDASAYAEVFVTARTLDDKSISGTLTKVENNQLFIGNDKLPLEDMVELTFSGTKPVAVPPPVSGANSVGTVKGNFVATGPTRKLTGEIIGTEGSYEDSGNTRDMAFDGDMATFFDAPAGITKDIWVGMDLGAPKVISRIKYCPRSGNNFPERMDHGKFQGSMNSDFSGAITLFEVKETPGDDTLTAQSIAPSKPVRYVRYLAPAKSNGNVAEIEFWGRNTVEAPSAPSATSKPVVVPATPALTINIAASKPAKAAPASRPSTNPSVANLTTTNPSTHPSTHPATHPSTQPSIANLPAWSLAFANGDKISAPITAWDEKKVHVNHSTFAKESGIDFPIESITELWKGTADQIKLARAVVLATGPEDAAFVLKDKEVVAVRGIAMGMEGESLRFKFGDEEKKINLAKLVGVMLLGNTPPKSTGLLQTVEFTDGGVITGVWKSVDPAAKNIVLETNSKSLLTIGTGAIAKIRTTNGRLVHVEDMKPASVEETPFFDRTMSYKINKSLTGAAIKLSDNVIYARGISVHSRCVLTYEINGNYDEFKSLVGFQTPEGKLGQAVVRVLGDGKVLYENLSARGDAKPAEVSIKVAGVNKLTLEVDFGANEDTADRVAWVNPNLIRQKK